MTPRLIPCALVLCAASAAHAQLSLATSVDLALRNSPKVKMAADDLARTKAQLSEAHDAYIPAVSVGAGLGDSYGYSPYPPTLFTFQAQSLVYNASQRDYIRSAKAGYGAAELALKDAREATAEDAAVTFAQLDRDLRREAAIREQFALEDRLVTIVHQRFDAGLETRISVLTTEFQQAQMRVALDHAEDETAADRIHLGTLTGLPSSSLRGDGVFPPFTEVDALPTSLSPGVEAAFGQAKAKQEQAWGDAHFLYRPQVGLAIQYERYATFSSSFQNLPNYQNIGANNEVYGVQISIPLFDKVRQAKARESAADAAHALHEAEGTRATALEGQARLTHSLHELHDRATAATLAQQLSQAQLDAVVAEASLPPAGSSAPQVTPKEEQSARIAEREKYLDVLDATFQLRQAELDLLRTSGLLVDWLKQTLNHPGQQP